MSKNIEKNEKKYIVNGTEMTPDEIREWLRSVDVYTAMDYVNNCLNQVSNTGGLKTEVFGISYSTASDILQEKGAGYVATSKQFVLLNPFTQDEILALKALVANNKTTSTSENNDTLAFRIAEIQQSGKLKGESMNRTFNIDTNIYNEFQDFMKKQKKEKSLQAKDIIVVAITEFMEKYAYPSGYVYEPKNDE